jgi:serine/threonine-protein phosphatase 2B catalytic subunit
MDRNIARAVREKRPVPEIDFSLHQMEDGSQVSTLERVVKGMLTNNPHPRSLLPTI